MRQVRVLTGLLVLVVGLTPAAAAARTYTTPGYKGTTQFGAVVQPPPPHPITLGVGKYPQAYVDAAGTGHIMFAKDGGTDAPDAISYCRLARGQTSCASTATLVPPVPVGGTSGPYAGNFPGGNHDFDGPVPVEQGGNLFVVDRRFPDVVLAPDGHTSDSNVFEWSSNDGGASFTGPGIIGDNELGGGAVAYGGEAAPSIGTISRTQTGGTFFQGTSAGQLSRAKAQLGSAGQAYDGGLATDGVRPVAVFSDVTPTTYVREWSGTGDVNNAATWSTASFAGTAPRIAAGPAGVFVLYRDSLTGGNVLVRRIVAGQPTGAPVKLTGRADEATISESPSGQLAAGWIDDHGVELETSGDGVTWSPPQTIAKASAAGSLADLSLASTADGGGFATYIQNPQGAEDSGTVAASVFGTQRATGQPGLGRLPGGGVGSALGDKLATSTCSTDTFGAVTVELKFGCFAHSKDDPDLDISTGEINLNGISIVPDAGVKISIEPRLHEIDTDGSVSVTLKGPGFSVTIWHGALHLKLPVATEGVDLFDFDELVPPKLAGFPIDGDVDVKLVKDGVLVPISLKLPPAFGGITGSATLRVTLNGGLDLDSLEFKVGDVNLGGLELKDLDISYTLSGNVWKGMGTVNVPVGGKAASLTLAFEFDDGAFKSGSFFVGLPYPGVPLDLNDTPPQVYLSGGGLSLGLGPPSFGGKVDIGITPLYTAGADALRDYAFSLEGGIQFAFGDPVTITATATGYLYALQLATAKLVYAIPDQVTLTASSSYDLGIVKEEGSLSAIIDPQNKRFGGRISGDVVIDLSKVGVPKLPGGLLDGGTVKIPTQDLAINNDGFGVYIPLGTAGPFFGTITYAWGDAAPKVFYGQNVTGRFTAGLPAARATTRGGTARAADAGGFTVPAGTPSASLVVTGTDGAPDVTLIAPDGTTVPAVAPAPKQRAVAIGDATHGVTYVGLPSPTPGRWRVTQTPGSQVPITGLQVSLGVAAPQVHAHVGGRGRQRTLTYTVRGASPAAKVSFAEQTSKLLHVIGTARGPSGTLHFTPGMGPAGPRRIVAHVEVGGLPHTERVVATYQAPGPEALTAPRRLRIRVGAKRFTITVAPPRGATRLTVKITATDGRHLQLVLRSRAHSVSIPVVGYRDAIRVTVRGVSPTGRAGPAVSGRASRHR